MVALKTALIYDRRKGLLDEKVAVIVMVGIKGAFDGADHNRLLYHSRTQGWPETLVRWVRSFLQERFARISLDQSTLEPFPILYRLLWGSPISP